MTCRLEKVNVAVRGTTLIEDISLTCVPGRVTALLGPNGAGKSTVVSVLAGDVQPLSGRALLDGKPLPSWSAAQLAERRAVLTQSLSVDFPLRAFDVVGLGRLACRASPARDEAVIEAALSAVSALHLAGRDYATLSGGERQRVQIARALAQIWDRRQMAEAVYLFLDEPTSNLDLKQQFAMLEMLRGFAGEGAGVLCVLHDLVMARMFADTVVLMNGGRIAASGHTGDVLTAANVALVFGLPAEFCEAILARGPFPHALKAPSMSAAEPAGNTPAC